MHTDTSAPETAHTPDPGETIESSLRAQVLGPVRIWRDGVELDLGPRQQRCLFALLMARAGQQVGMREIVEILWAGNPPASAVNIVHKYVSSLRRLLEPRVAARDSGSWLVRQGGGYQLTDDPGMSDLVRFRALVGRAQVAARAGDDARALALYRDALRLWNGRYAGDLAETAFEVAEFDSINRELFDAAAQAAGLALRVNDPAGLLSLLRRIASWDPLNEPLQAQLVEVLDAAGHKVEALAVYDAVRARLDEEFALEPGPELRGARQRVLSRALAAEPGTGRRHDDPVRALPPMRRIGDTVRPAARIRPAQLPPDLPVFVGRESEMAFVENAVQRETGGPVVVGMSGMAGVGKSTLAVHLAHTLSAGYEDGQIYLDLRDGAGAEVPTPDALATILLSLGIPATDLPGQVDARVALYRSLTAGKKMIVLLDNARTIQQVRPLVPNSAHGLVLVTSRPPLPGLAAVEGAGLLTVELPSAETARQMLAARLPEGGPAESCVLDDIINLCGRLPLALALVAARASAFPGLAPAELMTQLCQVPSRLEAFARDGGPEDPRSLYIWSYEQLSEPAARLFRLLALSDDETVTVPVCASLLGVEPPETQSLLRELTESSLLCETAPGRFGSQVLVRAYARELLAATDSPDERSSAANRLHHYLLHRANYQI
ncbi:AfsR/SARP family transcriptional regulator [Kineosporia succinea]|uniref:DNA-binding SARP family transcriptional activator n=1 Tax=Kineosporia succinea TaxID=84632 RepID=A0ABT9PEY2_9ACTN|nr:BTAD domain-containing putative transcriptional regulator [Kineosporia succinea]MDP9830954.1 DNA-binding SARP family transcriptional activator [Kineosporia succinea]